jgi:predicted metalloprotease with PDZ domain
MPQGLPKEGDRGLDNTPTWGRTYWGGALFCLLADVGIREHTANRLGLEDALRAINRKGGNIDTEWPLEHALQIGDRATGVSTLTDLYRQMGSQPGQVDLPALWERLGVRRTGETTTFVEDAPLAATRRAIMKGSAA